MSRLDLTLDPKTVPTRRVEVITGAGGRRRWTDDEKAQAIEGVVGAWRGGLACGAPPRRDAATIVYLAARGAAQGR